MGGVAGPMASQMGSFSAVGRQGLGNSVGRNSRHSSAGQNEESGAKVPRYIVWHGVSDADMPDLWPGTLKGLESTQGRVPSWGKSVRGK